MRDMAGKSDVTLAGARRSPWPPRVAGAGFGLSALSALLLLFSPLGYRAGLADLGVAFSMLRWGAYLGVAAAVVCGLALALLMLWPHGSRRAFPLAAAGLVLGVAAYGYPALLLAQARTVPPIHDITTDVTDPPAFEALGSARASAPNKAEYAGEEVARQQRDAYPDVRPVTLAVPPDMAFDRALTAANDLGWEVAHADERAGRIEATDTTFWFGFKDDVVIRVRESEQGSVVDVRSMSRVGQSDLGANAKRIRAFVARLER
jgi:uncharacterized protein (DUF1499 family)